MGQPGVIAADHLPCHHSHLSYKGRKGSFKSTGQTFGLLRRIGGVIRVQAAFLGPFKLGGLLQKRIKLPIPYKSVF